MGSDIAVYLSIIKPISPNLGEAIERSEEYVSSVTEKTEKFHMKCGSSGNWRCRKQMVPL
jgi:hypothetical protein